MPSVFIDTEVLCEARQFSEVALKSVIELSDLMKHFRHLTGSSGKGCCSSHQIFGGWFGFFACLFVFKISC